MSNEIESLIRQLADALLRELQAQTGNGKKRKGAKPATDFAQLPDDARVDVRTVSMLFGCATATVWRRVGAGIIPAPERIGGSTRWRAGDLRLALKDMKH